MATIALQRVRVAKTTNNAPPVVLSLPEAASLTAVAGEFVYLSGGYVTEIGANPDAILGMLAENGHNDSAGVYEVDVVIANDSTVFSANKSNSSGSAAATAQTDVGKPFALYRDTTNSKTYIYPDMGYERVTCVGLDHRDTVGDTGGRLLFIVLGRFRQLFCTS